MGLFKEWNKENTNLPWVCCRKFSKLFGEINLGIRHWLCQWVIFFFASKGQLGINCLVACNNYHDFKFFYTEFLHGDGQAKSCQNFLYSLKCTRILAIFNLPVMPKSSNCCKFSQSMYEPLSSGHRGTGKEYFVHNGVKHCQRLTFNVTNDYLNKTRLVQSQCRTLRFKQIKHDAPCYAWKFNITIHVLYVIRQPKLLSTTFMQNQDHGLIQCEWPFIFTCN